MRHNRSLSTVTVVLMISIISALGMFAAPVAASTTTYADSGTNRPILERANNATTGSIAVNNTALNLGLPSSTWKGYQMATSFTNLLRNADYIVNGQFSGSQSPWTFNKNPVSTSYISGFWASSPPSGTTTGANYVRLQGNTSQSSSYLSNQNFTSSSSWTGSVANQNNYGSYTSNWVSANAEWQERGTYSNPSYSYYRTGSAYLYCDQYFSYSGSVPPQSAFLSYKFYVSQWTGMSYGGAMNVSIILTRYPPSGGNVNNTLFTYRASSTTSKPSNPISVDITSYIASTGTYRVRLSAYISLVVPPRTTSTASVNWDDVGVYIKYGSYSPGSYGQWSETWNFGQPATANGMLSFKYWTNITTLVSSSNSFISAWVGSSQYNIIAFSSATLNNWQTATLSVPVAAFNASAQVTIKLGVYAGSNLQVAVGFNPRFYFDNVTFFIKYKPTPASIKLGIKDDTYLKRWNSTGTAGSGSLTITPARTWNATPALFHFVTNASGVTFSFTSTIYASRWSWTDHATFTVSDDTRTFWYCNYSTPSDIGRYQNYNTTIYVPADWLNTAYQGGINQIKFNGIVITDYTATIFNSTTGIIKIPASALAPNPPRFLLEIWAFSANYVGPSQLRTLLFTQVYNKTSGVWTNTTSFEPGNVTRLVCYLRNGSGRTPSNVNLFSATVRLYNQSGNFYKSRIWITTPYSNNGTFSVTLNPWNGTTSPYYQNVTYNDLAGSHGISWYFAVNWTNGYESANGIAKFNTSFIPSYIKPTTLTSPKQPYTGTYVDDIRLVAIYTNMQNSTGIMGASVTWRWINQQNVSSMTMDARGNYTATVYGPTAYLYHFAPQGTWIQINASSNGFISQSIQVRVFVRDIATTGTASSFQVPYQTYDWNSTVQSSLTYMDTDHNLPIAGATLYLNKTFTNATIIGSSGIRWWYRYFGSGTYQIFFNATASTPSGLTTWVFNVTATQTHYRTVSFYLNGFQIQDRPTTHTEPSLSVVTPWNDNVVFLITYRDLDANGAPPIFGATPSCTWRGGIIDKDYFVTRLSNGTYRFSLNVTGLVPGTYFSSFGFSKTHWAAITIISAQFTVRNICTNLSSLTPQITISWVNNVTVVLVYRDIDHNSNISYASWDRVNVYDQYTGQNYTLQFVFNIYLNPTYHSWNLRINGSLPIGDYTLWIHVSVPTPNGYYVDKWLYPTLSIGPVPTILAQQPTTDLAPVWGDPGKVVVNYTDSTHNGRPILNANVVVFINSVISWSAYENGSGIYTVFLNTTDVPTTPFPFEFMVQLSKGNYTTATISFLGTDQLTVYAIKTELIITPPQLIVKGSPANYTIQFWDTSHNRPIFNANITLIGITPDRYHVSELGNGTYTITLQTNWIPDQGASFQVLASKANYEPRNTLVDFKFPTGGLSLMTVLMIGGGSSGAVIIAVLGFIMYRRSKIPFVIKKIDQSMKLISRGEMPQPVPMRTRDEILGNIFQGKLAILSKEKLEEPRKQPRKGAKKPEVVFETRTVEALPRKAEELMEKRASEAEARAPEEPAAAEPGEADVDLIAKELEKLESKGEAEPTGEKDLIKREIEELEKEAKKKKKKGN